MHRFLILHTLLTKTSIQKETKNSNLQIFYSISPGWKGLAVASIRASLLR